MSNDHKIEINEVIDCLIELFPNAFFKTAKKVKPLSLGIMDDLIDFYQRMNVPPFSKKQLRHALSYYTSSNAYLKAQVAGAPRLDLSGETVDVVDKEQEQYAKDKLQARREKVKVNNETAN